MERIKKDRPQEQRHLSPDHCGSPGEGNLLNPVCATSHNFTLNKTDADTKDHARECDRHNLTKFQHETDLTEILYQRM